MSDDRNSVAAPSGPGSHPSDQAPAGLGASRFDPSRDDLVSRREVALWLAARGADHAEAAKFPRQSLPDRLRREGSAGTCRMLADQIWSGWGVTDPLKRPSEATASDKGIAHV